MGFGIWGLGFGILDFTTWGAFPLFDRVVFNRQMIRYVRSFFSNEKTSWFLVGIYLVFLYSTLTIAFDLYVSVFDRIGRQSMSWWMNAAIITTSILILAIVLTRIRPTITGWMTMILIGLTLAFCLQNLPVPAKRFHFFQYVPLTVLIFHALRFRIKDPSIHVWTMTLVTLAGLGDETIQWLLPDRHFGILDLVINSTAGLLTVVFIGFVWDPLKKEK
jgi:hypothetical protein